MSPTDAQIAESSTAEFIPLSEMTGEQRDAWLKTGDVPTKEASAPSTESSEAETAEGGPDAPETAAVSETEQHSQEQPKPKRGAEARKHELASEIQTLLEERARLRGELEGLKSAKGDKPAETPAAAREEAQQGPPKKPVSTDFQTYEEYDTALDEYHAAMVDYKVNEALQQREMAKQQAVVRTTWDERANKAAADPERGKIFEQAVAEIGPFLTQAGVQDAVLLSEVGPEILIYLHEHPDETLALAKTGSAVVIARELGKIEARFIAAAKTAPAKTETPVKQTTKAPPPATELSGKTAAPSDEAAEAVKAGDFARYQQIMNRRDLKA